MAWARLLKDDGMQRTVPIIGMGATVMLTCLCSCMLVVTAACLRRLVFVVGVASVWARPYSFRRVHDAADLCIYSLLAACACAAWLEHCSCSYLAACLI